MHYMLFVYILLRYLFRRQKIWNSACVENVVYIFQLAFHLHLCARKQKGHALILLTGLAKQSAQVLKPRLPVIVFSKSQSEIARTRPLLLLAWKHSVFLSRRRRQGERVRQADGERVSCGSSVRAHS